MNIEFDVVRVQILGKELPSLNETIAIIRAEEDRREAMIEHNLVNISAFAATKGKNFGSEQSAGKDNKQHDFSRSSRKIPCGALTVKKIIIRRISAGKFTVGHKDQIKIGQVKEDISRDKEGPMQQQVSNRLEIAPKNHPLNSIEKKWRN